MGDPGDELVVIVDRDNRVTVSATRRRMREQGLPHRATYILVFNSHGEIYVQRRTMCKDVYPGYLDPVAGGVVLAGESYEESARRELAEEMGIDGVIPEPLFDFWFEQNTARVWGRAFRCVWDGPLRLQPEEVEEVLLMEPEYILRGGDDFTPDGLLAVRLYFRREPPGTGA
jgi:isopentenyldiphosphate isomerase